jgi:LytS/YehU family sensor histidine kinase
MVKVIIMAKGKNVALARLLYSSMFLALGLLLPFLTMQIPTIGASLCPMHFAVMLCGFISGPTWGMAVGFITPILRSMLFGAPIAIVPNALAMAFELATYGAIAGLMHKFLPRKKPFIYCSLLVAMVAGRIAWGIMMFICLAASGGSFTFAAFIAGAITNAIPGIIVQIVLVPVIVMLLDNPKILKLED